jgi:hypothetical protein
MRVLSGCLRGGHGVRGSAVAARTAEYGVYRSGHADAVALTAVFLAAVFLAAVFLAAVFLAAVFLAAVFLAAGAAAAGTMP